MSNNKTVSHIAIFEKEKEGRIYFIDSFSTDNMVEERNYLINDSRFISFGRMLIRQ